MLIICSYCSKQADKMHGEVNRSIRGNRPIYCDRKCAGLGRRKPKAIEQKKAEKKVYDAQYRERKREYRKKQKAEYFKRTYDPVKAAVERKKTMARHVEYCRRPEYKAKKREFDRVYRAKQDYGQFWEESLIIMDIRREALSQQSRYEMDMERGRYNKSKTRKREYEKSKRTELEAVPLGNLIRNQIGNNATWSGGLNRKSG